MPKESLDSALDVNFNIVREYINTGRSKILTEQQKKTLTLTMECFSVMKKYPQRNICINRLMVMHPELIYNTAARYVDFTRDNFGVFVNYKREFLEAYFLEKLMSEIADPGASEAARAKNLATLQKYLEKLPTETIDPKLMEQNNVYIQVNYNGSKINIPEKVLDAMPMGLREQLLDAMDGEISDSVAEEMMES